MPTKDAHDASAAKELLERKDAGSSPRVPRALEHLALAILAGNGADAADALSALDRMRNDFVDWNEVRVARVQEIARSLDPVPGAEKSAKEIRDEYNAFFEKKGALVFDFLAAGKPSEVRRQLAQLMPRLGKGATSILLYEFCPGASLPLSDEGLKQARKDGVAGKTGDRNQLARILSESLELSEAALLLQYWELEATGSPYGEPLKKDAPAKKTKKATKKKA
jgi:hypothetical protein